MFTYEYAQIPEYSFCQDSVLAPLAIAHDLRTSIEVHGLTSIGRDYRALDLCAGCGVMGFELQHKIPEIENFDFLEIQTVFEDAFRKNLKTTNRDSMNGYRWLNIGFSKLREPAFEARYDLIVSNPPYFDAGEGSLSDNEVRNRCRFFLDDSFHSMLKSIRVALRPGGRAYILMKSGKKHGRDAFTLARTELFDCEVDRIADIRGTDLVRIISPRLST